jgi:hypothetical protein
VCVSFFFFIGDRLIIVHAITRDGPMVTRAADGSVLDPGMYASLAEPLETCELIFKGKNFLDYHETMNGELFFKWVKNRFIPTFKKLYPGKKAVLVLDNAAYHLSQGKGIFALAPSKKKKSSLAPH